MVFIKTSIRLLNFFRIEKHVTFYSTTRINEISQLKEKNKFLDPSTKDKTEKKLKHTLFILESVRRVKQV